MEDTLTLQLYSPLTAELETEAAYDAYYDEPDIELLRGGDLIYYQDAILEGIAQEALPEETERGLMQYFHGSAAVDEKVVSVKTTVENVHGTLYGAAVCKLAAPLSPKELEELKSYITGQLSDGNVKCLLM